jgi:ribosomal protein L20
LERANQRGCTAEWSELQSAHSWLHQASIAIDRKILAALAVHDPKAFSAVADLAKERLAVAA